MISIHAAADQIVQWWDAYVCQQSKLFLKMPLGARHYIVLFRLEQMGIVKHTGQEDLGEIEYWDLSDRSPVALKGERLSRIRREIHFPEEGQVTTRGHVSLYDEALNQGMLHEENHRDCQNFVFVILISIANGDAELLGWDKRGRMNFLMTAQGSRKTGVPANKLFKIKMGSRGLSALVRILDTDGHHFI
jgi:hypothetical protein